jgi:hypothetical protein
MPYDESFALRTTIETHLVALGRSLRTFASGLPATAANFALLVGRLDPEFLNGLRRIDTDETLTPVGKARAALQLGKAAAVSVDRFRKEHVGVLDTRIAQEQRTIDDAIAAEKRATRVDPMQVDAMRSRLDGLDPVEVTSLYLSAPPPMQILIEAVADLTGGKVPLRGERGTGLRWVDMLSPTNREEVMRSRHASAAPDAAARLTELEQLRDVYHMVLRAADALIEDELAKRGAMPQVVRFLDPDTGMAIREPLGDELRAARS